MCKLIGKHSLLWWWLLLSLIYEGFLERKNSGRQVEKRKSTQGWSLFYFLEDVDAYIWSLYLYNVTVSRQICDPGSLNIFESWSYLRIFKVNCEVENFWTLWVPSQHFSKAFCRKLIQVFFLVLLKFPMWKRKKKSLPDNHESS